MVQEDPKDFLCDIGDFLAPELVRTRSVHAQHEVDRGLVSLWFLGLGKVGEDLAGALFQLIGRRVARGSEVCDYVKC